MKRNICLPIGAVAGKLALLGALAAGPIAAQEPTASSLAEFHGSVYPEWLVQRFGQPSTKGTLVGNLGTLRNDSIVLSKDAKSKPDTEAQAWSNSYVGIRGAFRTEAFAVGYDYQIELDLTKNSLNPTETRDAFVYLESPLLGRLAIGKMDSIYKEFGDQVRMLGVSSSNIVSTAKVLSGVGWKGGGITTFHNRRADMVTWYSPTFYGLKAGLSYSWDDSGNVGRDPRLAAAALNWSGGPWSIALMTEAHRNWLPLSFGALAALPSTSLLNQPDSTRSQDRAWRLSLAWKGFGFRIGADVARLAYAEEAAVDSPGKFRNYRNSTGQVSAEYKWNAKLLLSANVAYATAGSGTLSGAVPLNTQGLGGFQTSLGALYAFKPYFGLFALAVRMRNGDAAYYGSAPQGANVHSLALGVKLRFAVLPRFPGNASGASAKKKGTAL